MSIKDFVEDIFDKNPEIAAEMHKIKYKIRKGYYDKNYIDSIFQLDIRSQFDAHDVYFFYLIHEAILSGKIIKTEVYVKETPFADKDIENNNRVLKNNLPLFFEAKFNPTYGYGYNDDGKLKWTKPLFFEKTTLNEKNEQVKQFVKVGPRSTPLEVGTTKPETTFLHLFKDNTCLSRWAYNSDSISIFCNTDFIEEESVTFEEYIQEFNISENGMRHMSDSIFKGDIIFKDGIYRYSLQEKRFYKIQN